MKQNVRAAMLICVLVICRTPTNGQQTGPVQRAGTAQSPTGLRNSELEAIKRRLLEKYDANRNGEIDVEERRGYVRELAKARKDAERRMVAAAKQDATRERRVVLLDWWDREILRHYDTNKDGRLDTGELQKVPKDRLKAAQDARRSLDTNGDGVVDKWERIDAESKAGTATQPK